MKKIDTIFLFIFVLVSLVTIPGCWDYREINNLAIVSGVAIDKSSDGNGYLLTAEIVDVRGGAKEVNILSKRIQSEGKTIFDATRNMIRISAKMLYWGHVDIVVISQDVARKGILPIIDFLLREREPRLFLHILVSKEKTAKEMLSQQSITTDIRSMEMKEMIETERRFVGKSPHVDLRNFINTLAGEGQAPVLATVGIVNNEGNRTSELSGSAVFKGDKLVGFLNGEDTKFLLFVLNQIHDTLLTLNENGEDVYNGTTLEIHENKTKITPIYSNGNLSVDVDIKAKANLGELGVRNNLIDEKGVEILKREAEKTLKSNVEKVIRKVKSEYDLDILGFGNTIKREMPSLWKSMDANWNEMFRDLDVNVHVTIDIRGSGLSQMPIKVGE
ncbi:MAG: Ger(x)C family spore germination protein [Acidobacteriota bacterium]